MQKTPLCLNLTALVVSLTLLWTTTACKAYPTPTLTPTATFTPSPTPTSTFTPTPTLTPTFTPTSTPTFTPTPSPTPTPTPTRKPTPKPTPTNTPKPSGQATPLPANKGCYLIQNFMGVELTFTFTRLGDQWNDTFKVPAGSEYIYCLDPGRYTYTIDAPPPWASVNGELTVNPGDRYRWPVAGKH